MACYIFGPVPPQRPGLTRAVNFLPAVGVSGTKARYCGSLYRESGLVFVYQAAGFTGNLAGKIILKYPGPDTNRRGRFLDCRLGGAPGLTVFNSGPPRQQVASWMG